MRSASITAFPGKKSDVRRSAAARCDGVICGHIHKARSVISTALVLQRRRLGGKPDRARRICRRPLEIIHWTHCWKPPDVSVKAVTTVLERP